MRHRIVHLLVAVARAGPVGSDGEPGRGPEPEADGDPTHAPTVHDLFDITRPEVTLDDIAGMDDVKERLRLGFLGPLRRADALTPAAAARCVCRAPG